jgi:hypothetical protein
MSQPEFVAIVKGCHSVIATGSHNCKFDPGSAVHRAITNHRVQCNLILNSTQETLMKTAYGVTSYVQTCHIEEICRLLLGKFMRPSLFLLSFVETVIKRRKIFFL